MDLCDNDFILRNEFLKQDENEPYIQFKDRVHIWDMEHNPYA